MKGTTERRLAAILAADVVGFSKMMGIDEMGTLDSLRSCRAEAIDPAIDANRGRIFKTTGDGVLVEFTSAVQAVECAIAVQKSMAGRNADVAPEKRIVLRVGINLGDIIADGDDVFGDGVNIAARLEGVADPGGICLSRAVYEQVKGKVGAAIQDLGPRQFKNIASPVDVYGVVLGEGALCPVDASAPPPIKTSPSIAVLPLACLSEDRLLELTADGLVEDIVALLARIPGFFVVSRSSTAGYRNQALDVRKVGHELGVRYVVEGSIRASATQVRVSVQLLDAESGKTLWTRRFDVERKDALDLQDEIAASVMAELEPALDRAEIAVIERQRPENLDAWAHYRKALGPIVGKGWTKEAFEESVARLRQTIPLDPDFALPKAQLALFITIGRIISLLDDSPTLAQEAQEFAEGAIHLDPNSSEVLGLAGCALCDLGQLQRGREVLERALELNPSNAQARMAFGTTQVLMRQAEEGIASMRMAMRLSPRDSRLAFWGTVLANFLASTGRLDEALDEALAACRRDARLFASRVVAASVLLLLKREPEARAALAEARRIRPQLQPGEITKLLGRRAAQAIAPIWD